MTQTEQHKLLFLPFLQIPSGHHQVADTLMYKCKQQFKKWNCDKVDILSYSYGKMEQVVSAIYLAWIKRFPTSYHWLYYHSSYKNSLKKKGNSFYGTLFLPFFKKLINEKDPDILICTHALPSNIASRLKQQHQINQIVINVYTDYFINRVWGISGIDFHFVPTKQVKDYLLAKGVAENKICITGIPVHPVFFKKTQVENHSDKLSVLVTGGNLGIGGLENLFTKSRGAVHYYVLCGKNKTLFERLVNFQQQNVTPFPYIACREKMNQLYDQVDAILTKPGGVTISECLMKRKPIFVYRPLPGQEKINVEQLSQLGVILPIHDDDVETQIIHYFSDIKKLRSTLQCIDDYHQNLEEKSLPIVINELLKSV